MNSLLFQLYQSSDIHVCALSASLNAHASKWFNSIWCRNIPTCLYHIYAIVSLLYIWLLKLVCDSNFDINSDYLWKMLLKNLTLFYCSSTVIILFILLPLFSIGNKCLTNITFLILLIYFLNISFAVFVVKMYA